LNAAPAGIGNLAGLADIARSAAGRFTDATSAAMASGTAATTAGVAAAQDANRGSSGRKWLWLLVLAIILFLPYGWCGRQNATTEGESSLGAIADSTDSMANRAGASLSTAAAKLGQFVDRQLPNGTTLNVPENGIESKLIAFITDPSQQVNDTTW